MNHREMLQVVQAQLAIDLNCTVADLNGETDSFVFTLAKDNPGRRPFARSEQHFDMLTMGRSIVVSTTPELMPLVKAQIEGKSRDEAFSLPFVYGHSLYYLPEGESLQRSPEIAGYTYELIEQAEMDKAYLHQGFHNAVQYDFKHPRPDVLALIARKNGLVVGMAGASADCATMWQIGIDVLPQHRNLGLAAYLVNRLTLEVLRRGFVPYYGTASSNLASQHVAHSAGYVPAWVNAYRGRFEGHETLPTC